MHFLFILNHEMWLGWLLFFSSIYTVVQAQEPFYANRNLEEPLLNRIRFNDYKNEFKDGNTEIDANEIIAPIMSPFVDMFDMMQQNERARKYAEKVKKERDESPFSNSKSIFDIIERLQRPPTTTTPQPPLIERLLKPYIEPWQRQFDTLTRDMTGITLIPTTTTTTTSAPVTKKQSILEKSLAVFFPQLRKTTTTPAPTPAPKLFDPDLLERLLFSRDKRDTRNKRQAPELKILTPTPPPIFPEWEKPILEASNPFTPNPLMAMFTMKPLPEVKLPEAEKAKPIFEPGKVPLMEPKFKLQDPFYNPLFPKRKSKFFDMLAGGEAVRILG